LEPSTGSQSSTLSSDIIAAGGLVMPPSMDQVVLVHRLHHGDWSFPKGKLDPGEMPLVAASREVREESGIHAIPIAPAGWTRYQLDNGEKVVFWYLMIRDPDAIMTPDGRETDQVASASFREAYDLLSYEQDIDLLASVASRLSLE
jgi:8-oxo-dGTP pyrophosphatase MutT (NUDIX family)